VRRSAARGNRCSDSHPRSAQKLPPALPITRLTNEGIKLVLGRRPWGRVYGHSTIIASTNAGVKGYPSGVIPEHWPSRVSSWSFGSET